MNMLRVLLCLHIFVIGVSWADNCGEIRNILAFPREAFTLDFYQDDVKEITLLDGSGKDIAKIENGGDLKLLDKSYGDNLSSQGFSFLMKNGAKEGKWDFTSSVLYMDDTHCSQHYMVIVTGDQICSETKKTEFTAVKPYFTLHFDATGVKEITWVDTGGWTMGITKYKARLQILHPDYEGRLSVSNVSLHKQHAAMKDQGRYTAIVQFHNGSSCLQRYSVDYWDYSWYNMFIPDQNKLPLLGILTFVVLAVWFWRTQKPKICGWLKGKTESEQDEAGPLPRKNGLGSLDTLPPENNTLLVQNKEGKIKSGKEIIAKSMNTLGKARKC